MENALIIAGILLHLAGLLGCFLPVIPGPPLSYAALVLLQFAYNPNPFSTLFMVVLFVVVIIVTVLDYVIPIWGTKKMGGTKAGKTGSTIGLIVGAIGFPPLGIIIGPFLGALFGEMYAGSTPKIAWLSAFGTFLGFLAGTFMKIILCCVMIYYFIAAIV